MSATCITHVMLLYLHDCRVQYFMCMSRNLVEIGNNTVLIDIVLLQGDREIEIDDDLKQLSFYSITTGDTILLRW